MYVKSLSLSLYIYISKRLTTFNNVAEKWAKLWVEIISKVSSQKCTNNTWTSEFGFPTKKLPTAMGPNKHIPDQKNTYFIQKVCWGHIFSCPFKDLHLVKLFP